MLDIIARKDATKAQCGYRPKGMTVRIRKGRNNTTDMRDERATLSHTPPPLTPGSITSNQMLVQYPRPERLQLESETFLNLDEGVHGLRGLVSPPRDRP